MDKWLCSLLEVLVLCSGCSSSLVDQDSEQRAKQHTRTGRALESASRWNEAAMEYAIVAELYPRTGFYEDAVRKAALLFSHPDNPARSDSTALHWFRVYEELPLSDPERHSVQLHVRAIEEMSALRGMLDHQTSITDSLSGSSKQQQQELMAQSKQIHELELEIAKLNEELDKLREIDMKVGRNKENQP